MIGCLRTHVRKRKQPIVALKFESETVFKFYNLEARYHNFFKSPLKNNQQQHFLLIRPKRLPIQGKSSLAQSLTLSLEHIGNIATFELSKWYILKEVMKTIACQ